MTRFVDLSHQVISGVTGYPGLPAPRIEPHVSHEASRAAYAGAAEFEITRVFMVGNSGTYLDSPYHRFPDGQDVAELPLSSLARVPGRVLEARLAHRGRRIELDVVSDDGLLGAAVLLRTRWDEHWGSDRYWDLAPFVPVELAERLARLRVALVGIDTWNIDDVHDPTRPAHTTLLRAHIPIVEHLTGLGRLPPAGFWFSAVPSPVVGASSMPVRAYAELPEADGGI